ncbi:hypothetical protein [Chitinophaga ginsengisoli]|uniref:Uncharacterized protein n=1 Tax=Chitinophaga ginsengisoli TaxID=363837 RepID=A0A2P8FAR2_9BACT|nr:hypothetical protein [Chitinophaga ginsengisoli]PSL18815.1 hypothetical protein CLV42_1311 [Chitinophaga ginsengisoli]
MFEIIYYKGKKDGHRDIVITISAINFHSEVDSYYLCIDPLFMPEHETPDKVEKCLRLMIKSWVATIDKMEVDQTVYLPYDFSDQYVGVLGIKMKSDGEVYFSAGHTTRYCGYEISPSRDTALNLKEDEFANDGGEVVLSKDILINQLSSSLRVL